VCWCVVRAGVALGRGPVVVSALGVVLAPLSVLACRARGGSWVPTRVWRCVSDCDEMSKWVPFEQGADERAGVGRLRAAALDWVCADGSGIGGASAVLLLL